jgi:hypothetical protein
MELDRGGRFPRVTYSCADALAGSISVDIDRYYNGKLLVERTAPELMYGVYAVRQALMQNGFDIAPFRDGAVSAYLLMRSQAIASWMELRWPLADEGV